MKQIITIAVILVLSVSGAFAKDRVSGHTTVKGEFASITYGQPAKKGRVIFGGLVPYGQVWRTGADEATEITLKKDCFFGNKQVKAGTYTLFTIPGEKYWDIILNAKLGQWGAFDYDKVKNQDVIKVKAGVKHIDQPVETFTISVMHDGFKMEWDKTSVFVDIKPIAD